MDLSTLLALFLARLAGGYAICLSLFGPSVKEGSWRRISLFVITGLCLAGMGAGLEITVCAATAAAALLLERAIAFGAPAFTIVSMLPFGLWLLWPPGLANLPGAITAGGTLGAMLLGHSYLTARGLSFGPLRRMSLLLLVVLLVRAALVAPLFFDQGLVLGDLLYLTMRSAFGLLLPIVFCWMAYQCTKIESNQSATGLLYTMTALVFLGELTAVYLQMERGIAA